MCNRRVLSIVKGFGRIFSKEKNLTHLWIFNIYLYTEQYSSGKKEEIIFIDRHI